MKRILIAVVCGAIVLFQAGSAWALQEGQKSPGVSFILNVLPLLIIMLIIIGIFLLAMRYIRRNLMKKSTEHMCRVEEQNEMIISLLTELRDNEVQDRKAKPPSSE